MKKVPLLFFFLLFFNFTQAQFVVHHNCWDIDISELLSHSITQPLSHLETSHTIAAADSGIMLVAMAKEYLGTPYRRAGRSPKGFDCAGFALFLYRHFGHSLPGWSGAQAKLGTPIDDTRELRAGDLVFFGGRRGTKQVGHTGIVVSADTTTGIFTFIHSSTSNGVIISRSTEEYYARRYLSARRIFQ